MTLDPRLKCLQFLDTEERNKTKDLLKEYYTNEISKQYQHLKFKMIYLIFWLCIHRLLFSKLNLINMKLQHPTIHLLSGGRQKKKHFKISQIGKKIFMHSIQFSILRKSFFRVRNILSIKRCRMKDENLSKSIFLYENSDISL